jgi:hypothetical protein
LKPPEKEVFFMKGKLVGYVSSLIILAGGLLMVAGGMKWPGIFLILMSLIALVLKAFVFKNNEGASGRDPEIHK